MGLIYLAAYKGKGKLLNRLTAFLTPERTHHG